MRVKSFAPESIELASFKSDSARNQDIFTVMRSALGQRPRDFRLCGRRRLFQRIQLDAPISPAPFAR